MDLTTMIGFIAGTLTTIAFIPQLLKAWRTKSTEDISVLMFVTFTTGVALWLVYGWMLGAWPIIVTNVITVALASAILALKLKYG